MIPISVGFILAAGLILKANAQASLYGQCGGTVRKNLHNLHVHIENNFCVRLRAGQDLRHVYLARHVHSLILVRLHLFVETLFLITFQITLNACRELRQVLRPQSPQLRAPHPYLQQQHLRQHLQRHAQLLRDERREHFLTLVSTSLGLTLAATRAG